ncbi:MAG TPA: hypothetical protein VD927_06830 [Chryseosolibacter sp.]|nr:hypothetical protein [Chryseosolibacter sp.]
MKTLTMILLIGLAFSTDPTKTGKINKAKREAKELFNQGDYKAAAEKYKYLVDSLGVTEEEVNLSMAHAYYLSKDSTNAVNTYQQLTGSTNPDIRSKANQQLGVITNKGGKPEQALSYFKQALKADPGNEDARYNYEMLKKKLEEKKKQDEQNKKDKKDDKNNKKQEPSEFAKKLKAQADKLVAQKQYRDAYNLMMDGLKKDQTVSTYQDYIDRTKDVAEINNQ